MADDGSIAAAVKLRTMAQAWMCLSDADVVDGIEEITGTASVKAMLPRLARLVDPVCHAEEDGSCSMCGAGPEAMQDAYCAHCGRRIVPHGEDE